jgi:hypothetical protein
MVVKKLRDSNGIFFGVFSILSIAGLAQSCAGGGGSSSPGGTNGASIGTAPTSTVHRNYDTGAMLFVGDGTWATEVTSYEAILSNHGISYQTATSAQLDAMTLTQLTQFGMFIFPGGTGSTQANSVSAQTHANLRAAVQTYGVSYLGTCAGAFIAVAPAPAAGQDVSYGFGIVNGPLLNEYSGPGTTADYESTLETFATGSAWGPTLPVLWYGGPVTPNEGVIAKYPTGDPAISEMWSGNGFVVLSGVHPTMTTADLDSLGVTPDTDDTSLAWALMNAALTQQPITPIF